MGTARFPLLRFKNSARLCSSSAAPIRRPWPYLTDDPKNSKAESAVYKRALKLQRPTTVKYWDCVRNSVSLIGTIELPLESCKGAESGVYTRLRVKASTGAHRHFFVSLKFWDEMAEMSVQHLKPDDLVYVWGHLESYKKVDGDGKSEHLYQVNVKEINLVTQPGAGRACQNLVKLESKVSFEETMQKRRNRLHLWHIFFANPYEWWDNRNAKPKPNHPDFKHKDTGEALWLHENDPPWIKQQLQLLDSRSLNQQNPGKYKNAYPHLSPLVYDDAEGT